MPTPEIMGPRGYGIPDGLRRLHDYLLARFPSTHSGGMYNPSSKTSGGAPSAHTVTQALDIMCDQYAGRALMMWAVANAEIINLQQAICWHQIITAANWSAGVRHYAPNDHSGGVGHLHLHIGWQAALKWMPPVDSVPTPIPISITTEEPTVACATFAYLDGVHAVWITPTGQLAHEYPRGVENLGPKDGTKLLQTSGVAVTVVGAEIQVRVKDTAGRLIRWGYAPASGWGIGADAVPA